MIVKMKGAREFSIRSKSQGGSKRDTGKKDSKSGSKRQSDLNDESNLVSERSMAADDMESAKFAGIFFNVTYHFNAIYVHRI